MTAGRGVYVTQGRIEQAKEDWNAADWENGPFKLHPSDDAEFIEIDPGMNRTKPKEWT